MLYTETGISSGIWGHKVYPEWQSLVMRGLLFLSVSVFGEVFVVTRALRRLLRRSSADFVLAPDLPGSIPPRTRKIPRVHKVWKT